MTSIVAAGGLQSAGLLVVAHRFSCLVAYGGLPRPGLKPVSPALAGRFLTSGPSGKSPNTYALERTLLAENSSEDGTLFGVVGGAPRSACQVWLTCL